MSTLTEPRAPAAKTMVEAVRDALAEEMRRDSRVIVLGLDVGVKGGVFGATRGLVQEFGESRVIDTPLAESAIAGVAFGAAAAGLLPVAEIQFADFIIPAMDQIINEIARLRYRTNGQLGCPLVIRAAYGGGVRGGLYHSQSVEAFFCHVPGLKVVAPAMPDDAAGLLKAAIRDPDPVLFLEHKKLYRSVRAPVPDDGPALPLGQAAVRRTGDQVTLISYGLMLHRAIEAAELVAAEGIAVEVVDLRTLAPFDKMTLLTSVEKTGKVLIVHEDNRTGGWGAEIAASIAEEAFSSLDAPVLRIAGPDVPAMPFSEPLERAFLPGVEGIAAGIRRLARY